MALGQRQFRILLQPSRQGVLSQEALCAFLAESDVQSTFAIHSKNQAISQIGTQLRRHDVGISALSGKNEKDPSGPFFHAKATYDL